MLSSQFSAEVHEHYQHINVEGSGIGEARIEGKGKHIATSTAVLLCAYLKIQVTVCVLGFGFLSSAVYLMALKQVNVPTLQILSLFLSHTLSYMALTWLLFVPVLGLVGFCKPS